MTDRRNDLGTTPRVTPTKINATGDTIHEAWHGHSIGVNKACDFALCFAQCFQALMRPAQARAGGQKTIKIGYVGHGLR